MAYVDGQKEVGKMKVGSYSVNKVLFFETISKACLRTPQCLVLLLLVSNFFYTGCKCSQNKSPKSEQSQRGESLNFDIGRFGEDPAVQKMVYEIRFSEIARRFGDVVFSQTYKLTISSKNRSIEFTNKE